MWRALSCLLLAGCGPPDDVPRTTISVSHELAAGERLVCSGWIFFIGLPTTNGPAAIILLHRRSFECEVKPRTD